MTPTITISGLDRAYHCTGSMALPRIRETSPWSSCGTAVHSFLERLAQGLDRRQALAYVTDARARKLCEVLEVADLPPIGGLAAEVAFAFDPSRGAVREIGRGLDRNYEPHLQPGEVPGTADLVGLAPDRVFVGDYKTGHSDKGRAHESRQLRAYAMMAARAYNRSYAVVEMVHLRDDGTVWRDRAELDAFDLDDAAEDIRTIVAAGQHERVRVESGLPPELHVGPWCRWCPAVRACPAQAGLVRRLVSGAELDEHLAQRPLDAETARRAYVNLKAAERALEQIRNAIYACAAAEPIDLGDGRMLGERETPRTVLDGDATRQALTELHGDEVAAKAVKTVAKKKWVEDALRSVYQDRKRAGERVTLKALNDEALEVIEDAGGLTVTTSRSVKEYRPKRLAEGKDAA